MNLFSKLLVAPAVLGLAAPVVATAGELHLEAADAYVGQQHVDRMTALEAELGNSADAQFSDVYPSDWAYGALAELAHTADCAAVDAFRGNLPVTRFEAAALVSACIDAGVEVGPLAKAFESEIAIMSARMDVFEVMAAENQATMFSTTTKLEGYSKWTLATANFGKETNKSDDEEGTFMAYDLMLELKTSFTGDDRLMTVLRSGNVVDSWFNTGVTAYETAFTESDDDIAIDRLYYTFPLEFGGMDTTVTLGPKMRTDDVLPWFASYPSDFQVDYLTYAGQVETNSIIAGTGIGFDTTLPGLPLDVSYVYIAADGNDPSSSFGIGGERSNSMNGVTLSYASADNIWSVGFGYSHLKGLQGGTFGDSVVTLQEQAQSGNAISLSGVYSFTDNFSISTGWGVGVYKKADGDTLGKTANWYTGFVLSDALMEDSALNFAFGEYAHVTASEMKNNILTAQDSSLGGELSYSIAATDNITITPGLFWISDIESENSIDEDEGVFGASLMTTFTF